MSNHPNIEGFKHNSFQLDHWTLTIFNFSYITFPPNTPHYAQGNHPPDLYITMASKLTSPPPIGTWSSLSQIDGRPSPALLAHKLILRSKTMKTPPASKQLNLPIRHNPKQLKKAFHMAQSTSQWWKKWSTDSPFILHIQYLSTTMTCPS